jgi:hypothetical protein
MAQTIKLKRSAATGNAPTASQIALGELAINTTDGRVYMKKGDDSILTLNPHALSEITNDMWEVTTTTPTNGNGKPAGYVWYIV